jgi:hypothetical protein
MNIKGEFNGIKWIGFDRQREGRRKELILKYREPGKEWRPTTAPKEVTSEVKFRAWAKTVLENLDQTSEPTRRGSGEESIESRSEDWLELRKGNPDVSGATYQGNRSDMKAHIVPKWGKRTFTGLASDLQELRAWVRELASKLSPIRVSNIISTFRVFVRDARLEKWTTIRTNPLESDEVTTVMPKIEKKRDVVVMPTPVAQALLDKTKEMRRVVRYAVALNTGAGDGELAGCVIGSVLAIDGDSPKLEIVQAFKKGTKEEGKRSEVGKLKNAYRLRPIPLNECARAALKAWIDVEWEKWVGRPPTPKDPLFPDSRGNFSRPYSSEWLAEDLAANDLPTHDVKGRKYEFRCLRRTFSTMLSEQEVDREIREQLMGQSAGHVNTDHYTAQVPAKHFSAVRSLPLKWNRLGGQVGGAIGGGSDGGALVPDNIDEDARFTNSLPSPARPANDGNKRQKLPRAAAKKPDESASRGAATKLKEAEREAGSDQVSTAVPNQDRPLRLRKTRSLPVTKNQRSGGWRGVYWNKRAKAWEVKVSSGEIKSDGRKRREYFGTYADPVMAARAADEASIRELGPDAPLNFEGDREDLVAYVAAIAEHTADGQRGAR